MIWIISSIVIGAGVAFVSVRWQRDFLIALFALPPFLIGAIHLAAWFSPVMAGYVGDGTPLSLIYGMFQHLPEMMQQTILFIPVFAVIFRICFWFYYNFYHQEPERSFEDRW